MKKIVVTGGPCSGKTTGLVQIQDHLEKLGYRVIVTPESATIVFNGAGRPKDPDQKTQVAYQKTLVQMQLELEKTFALLADENTIMLCDRGVHDSKAFMTAEEWHALVGDMGLNDYKLLNSYDAVIHLVTAAQGAPHAYKLEGQRNETPQQAIAQDNALQRAYLGHGHHKIIDNSTDFHTKIRRCVSEICHVLGVPEPLEIERKFLLAKAPTLPTNIDTSTIEQTYLLSQPNQVRRVRRRSQNGCSVYTMTTKEHLSAGTNIERESYVSGTEYLNLISTQKDPTRQTIKKLRHCFIHEGRCYELDEYQAEHAGLWVLEAEVEDLKAPLTFPDWLQVDAEVTADRNYSNASLALGKTPTLANNPIA